MQCYRTQKNASDMQWNPHELPGIRRKLFGTFGECTRIFLREFIRYHMTPIGSATIQNIWRAV
eukprot:3364532-Pyramimonas_sp.AAC.1